MVEEVLWVCVVVVLLRENLGQTEMQLFSGKKRNFQNSYTRLEPEAIRQLTWRAGWRVCWWVWKQCGLLHVPWVLRNLSWYQAVPELLYFVAERGNEEALGMGANLGTAFNFLFVSQNIEWVWEIFPRSRVLTHRLLPKCRISGSEPRNRIFLQCSNSLNYLLAL